MIKRLNQKADKLQVILNTSISLFINHNLLNLFEFCKKYS